MNKTHSKVYVHFMFGTKNGRRLIKPNIEKRLWRYIGAIGKKMGITPVAIGGDEDHLHLLLIVPPDLSVSFIMQKLKGASSKWMNDTFFPQDRKFRWQPGYAAFTVGHYQKQRMADYINDQKNRHKTMTYQEEYRLIVERYKAAMKKVKAAQMEAEVKA